MDREKVINQIEVDIQRAERTGEMLVYVGRRTAKDALALLKEQETVEHALDILRENGWKEEDKCEKCPLLMAVSDGVHDMAKQFRKGDL